MEVRHVILIIVIIVLILVIWYNREKWNSMYKTEGAVTINEFPDTGMVSCYVFENNESNFKYHDNIEDKDKNYTKTALALKIGCLQSFDDFFAEVNSKNSKRPSKFKLLTNEYLNPTSDNYNYNTVKKTLISSDADMYGNRIEYANVFNHQEYDYTVFVINFGLPGNPNRQITSKPYARSVRSNWTTMTGARIASEIELFFHLIVVYIMNEIMKTVLLCYLNFGKINYNQFTAYMNNILIVKTSDEGNVTKSSYYAPINMYSYNLIGIYDINEEDINNNVDVDDVNYNALVYTFQTSENHSYAIWSDIYNSNSDFFKTISTTALHLTYTFIKNVGTTFVDGIVRLMGDSNFDNLIYQFVRQLGISFNNNVQKPLEAYCFGFYNSDNQFKEYVDCVKKGIKFVGSPNSNAYRVATFLYYIGMANYELGKFIVGMESTYRTDIINYVIQHLDYTPQMGNISTSDMVEEGNEPIGFDFENNIIKRFH